MGDLVGRGYRVAGMLVGNVGAGFVLEGGAPWLGGLLVAIGVGLFAWGFVESRGLRATAVSPEDGEREPA